MLLKNLTLSCDARLGGKFEQFFIPGFGTKKWRRGRGSEPYPHQVDDRSSAPGPPSFLPLWFFSTQSTGKAGTPAASSTPAPRVAPVPAHLPSVPRPHLRTGRNAAEASGLLAAGPVPACKCNSRHRPRGPGPPPPSPRAGRRPCCPCSRSTAQGLAGEALGRHNQRSWSGTTGGKGKWESELRLPETALQKQ